MDSWIISPLKKSDEQAFILRVSSKPVHDKRLWVAFEAVKRNKPSSAVIGKFVALSPPTSKLRKTIGSNSYSEVTLIGDQELRILNH